jgi:hypothetical protein
MLIDEKARIRAVDTALYGNRLLDEKYFPRAAAAIKNKKKKDFHAVSREAGIPDDIQERMYKALSAIAREKEFW